MIKKDRNCWCEDAKCIIAAAFTGGLIATLIINTLLYFLG